MQIAEENNLIVMIHVSSEQQAAAEDVVPDYPNVNFLFHGEDYVDWVMHMMKNYENFYYSLDANFASLYGFDEDIDEQNTTSEQYLDFLEDNFEENLEWAIGLWQEAIENYPERFMWGTDRWYEWTYDPRIGSALAEFGRTFIGKLDPELQEQFAYKNAEKLVLRKKSIRPESLTFSCNPATISGHYEKTASSLHMEKSLLTLSPKTKVR